MIGFIHKYIMILEIELDDLVSDIELLMEKYRKRNESEEITDYVFLENLAVLKNQICGLSSLRKIVEEIDESAYGAVDEFVDDISGRFRARIEECDLSPSIFQMVKRKLEKVKTYVLKVDD